MEQQMSMNPTDSALSPTLSAPSRASRACIPCRSRHVKCDGAQPECRRCSSEGKECHYVKSRRGGLDRETLAIRRAQKAAASGLQSANVRMHHGFVPATRIADPVSCLTSLSYSVTHWSVSPKTDAVIGYVSTLGPSDEGDLSNVAGDPLIDLYYDRFHACHPCVLPRKHLERFWNDEIYRARLKPVILVMRFIGSLYTRPDISSQLGELVSDTIRCSPTHVPDPFMAQCRLLYSLALFWHGDKHRAREEIDAAIRIVFDLEVYRRPFAVEHGHGDAVLEECWRRTWWQICVIDAYYAAIQRASTFPLFDINTDVDLPCEADEFESGAILPSKTLEDFEFREFAGDEHHYSSFTYLIGATRGIALALSAVPAACENWSSRQMIVEVDAIIDGWQLLLPKSKQEGLYDGKRVYELMFQAHMAIHASTIALHRPFSDLFYDPLAKISSCISAPPDRLPLQESMATYTSRCLRAIEAQVRLLTLPVKHSCRTPFTICMTISGTIPLLSAARLLFSGHRLAVVRHQLRLILGCLQSLGEVWPQGCKNLDEIRTIAREVLGQRENAQRAHPAAMPTSTDEPAAQPCLAFPSDLPSHATTFETSIDNFANVDWSTDFQSDLPICFTAP
ncbi:hypothetical protein F5Y15DRAFT_102600 [Xylariaceae sp. FL0016]|nr:hypothetical protein F5Y15DRAFT_102600 [Xylariaceae sp. FL0016]